MAQINETPPALPVTVAEPVRNLVYAMIAKKPEDRPASAAHLARAATALRRGDVAGRGRRRARRAGAAGATAATMLMPQQGATAATTVLPSAGAAGVPDEPDDETEKKKRSPWTWPLIALIAILALVLDRHDHRARSELGRQGDAVDGDRPRVHALERTAVVTAPPTHDRRPTTIQIDRDSYIGMNIDDGSGGARGPRPARRRASRATAATEPGREHRVRRQPERHVPPGTTSTLTFYGCARRAERAVLRADDDCQAIRGQEDTDSPSTGRRSSCPAGQELLGLQAHRHRRRHRAEQPGLRPRTTSATVDVGDVDGGSFDRHLSATSAGQLDSPDSPALTVDHPSSARRRNRRQRRQPDARK